MLLVGDIGNSETILGLRQSDGSIAHRWRIRSDVDRTPDEVGVLLRSLIDVAPGGNPELEGCCFASVVPPLTMVLAAAARRYLGVPTRELRYTPELGIQLDVEEPEQVGPDRVANTLASHLAYPGPAIVIDFGTATNFDIISADGSFLGGVIAPGVTMAADTLASKAALLPRVAPAFPESFIGRTTVSNIQIGVYHGATALIDGLVERIRGEWEPDARVIATGGLASLMAERCRTVDVIDPDLTLKGIGWAYERAFPRDA